MLCDNCKRSAINTRVVNKYSRNEFTKKAYGSLLDNQINTQNLCNDCLGNAIKWTEVQFCDAMGIKPASIEGQIIQKQLEQKGCCA